MNDRASYTTLKAESATACRFCSHAPCICDEYLVTAEEAGHWWKAFASGSRQINPTDLRRLIVTVASVSDKRAEWEDEVVRDALQIVHSVTGGTDTGRIISQRIREYFAYQEPTDKPVDSMTVDAVVAEMSEHCRNIRIKAERIATARRCIKILEAIDRGDEERAAIEAIRSEFGLGE